MEPISDKQLIDSVTLYIGTGVNKFDYNYDNKNRLIDLHLRASGSTITDADYLYTYDDENKLIRSVVTTDRTIATYDFSYENKIPVLVTYADASNPKNNLIIKLKNNGSQITDWTEFSSATLPEKEGTTSKYIYENQNSTSQIMLFPPESGGKVSNTTNTEYGINKNPFIYTGYKWRLPGITFANKNDQLKETSVGIPGTTIRTSTYTYNKQGYPITQLIKSSTDGGPISDTKYVYKYIDAK
jgi:hypothetical protein